jgi:hypothetical protein
MRDQSSAETAAAIQILAHEILTEINAPVAVDLSASPMQSGPSQSESEAC